MRYFINYGLWTIIKYWYKWSWYKSSGIKLENPQTKGRKGRWSYLCTIAWFSTNDAGSKYDLQSVIDLFHSWYERILWKDINLKGSSLLSPIACLHTGAKNCTPAYRCVLIISWFLFGIKRRQMGNSNVWH
jgi:hypothetical protein